MRVPWTFVLVAALTTGAVSAVGAAGAAARDSSSLEEWRDYTGQLDGPLPIRMTLSIRADRHISGSYFYVKPMKDIPVVGEMGVDHSIVLRESAEPGKVTGIFRGKFESREEQGERLAYDQIVGCWSKPDGSAPRLFRLTQSGDRLRRPGENRYAVAGLADDSAVERFAQHFRAALLSGDRSRVAAAIHLPIIVRVAGWPIRIRHKEVLLARFDSIFSPGFRQALASAVPHAMFARNAGVMLGEHGEVWIGDRDGTLRVVAINN
jgi:hypothetical protein